MIQVTRSVVFALLLLSIPAASIYAEPADDGWIELFNGMDLSGWQQRGGTAKYHIEEGAIVGTTAKGSPNSFLCTENDYGDFELEFEVLVDPRLNSGVQIRSLSKPDYLDGVVHGYQVEIATPDHPGFSGGDAGSIWDESRRNQWIGPPRTTDESGAAFKANEWNKFRVVCRGDSIKTWVNGVPVADVTDDTTPSGFIGLQIHSFAGNPPATARWRNLRLRNPQ